MSTAIRDLEMPLGGRTDLWVMLGLSAVLLPFAARQRNLSRLEGMFLLAVYVPYMVWRTLQ